MVITGNGAGSPLAPARASPRPSSGRARARARRRAQRQSHAGGAALQRRCRHRQGPGTRRGAASRPAAKPAQPGPARRRRASVEPSSAAVTSATRASRRACTRPSASAAEARVDDHERRQREQAEQRAHSRLPANARPCLSASASRIDRPRRAATDDTADPRAEQRITMRRARRRTSAPAGLHREHQHQVILDIDPGIFCVRRRCPAPGSSVNSAPRQRPRASPKCATLPPARLLHGRKSEDGGRRSASAAAAGFRHLETFGEDLIFYFFFCAPFRRRVVFVRGMFACHAPACRRTSPGTPSVPWSSFCVRVRGLAFELGSTVDLFPPVASSSCRRLRRFRSVVSRTSATGRGCPGGRCP